MELNGWASSQMLHLYGACAGSDRARRTCDRIMDDTRHARCDRPSGSSPGRVTCLRG
jgi:hypothetical protein